MPPSFWRRIAVMGVWSGGRGGGVMPRAVVPAGVACAASPSSVAHCVTPQHRENSVWSRVLRRAAPHHEDGQGDERGGL